MTDVLGPKHFSERYEEKTCEKHIDKKIIDNVIPCDRNALSHRHHKLSSSLCSPLPQLQPGRGHKAGSASSHKGRRNANKAGFNQIESSLLVIHGFKIGILLPHSERLSIAAPKRSLVLAGPERVICFAQTCMEFVFISLYIL